jgi:hypothetical protein
MISQALTLGRFNREIAFLITLAFKNSLKLDLNLIKVLSQQVRLAKTGSSLRGNEEDMSICISG